MRNTIKILIPIVLIILVLQFLIHRGYIIPDPSFRLLFFSLHWYAIFILAGIAVIMHISRNLQSRAGVIGIEIEDALIWGAIPGVIFARFWHIVTDWHLYAQNPIESLYIWNGGLSIFGAVLGALLGLYIYTKRKNSNFIGLINLIAFSLPLAQIIGRYGNLFNREIYGAPTDLPWGLFVPLNWPNRNGDFAGNEYFHPVYLYEQIGNLILFLINIYLYKKFGFKNKIFITSWFIGYGIIRFLVEFIRIENRIVGPLSFSQLVALGMVLLGVIFLFIQLKRNEQ